jgi:hypothetical protein
MGVFIDLTGQNFGKLVVLERAEQPKARTNAFWLCKCVCNKLLVVNANKLRRGQTSCMGCRKPSNIKHGLVNAPEYNVWQNMRVRCDNPKSEHYHNYGGRGIRYSLSWNYFATFYKDMGPRPTSKHTLERQENDGNYCKENCVWATRKEQANNQRKTLIIEIEGIKKCASDWAKEYGIDAAVVTRRIKRGIDPITALTQKLILKTTINFNGEVISCREAERRMGWQKGIISMRRGLGFSDEEAISLPLRTKKRIIQK